MIKLSVIYTPLSKASSFVVEGVNRDDIEIVALKIRKKYIFKALFHLFTILKLYRLAAYFHFTKDTYVKLKKIKNKVLYFDCCRLNEYCVVNSLVNVEEKSIFFWNPLDNWSHDKIFINVSLQNLRDMGFALFSFDSDDCKLYDLSLLKNVNRKVDIPYDNKFVQDFYFIGQPKGRENDLLRLKMELEKKGYSTKFIFIRSIKDYVSLFDNLKNSRESKCIVDWVAPNQVGLTLRPFDALFLKTKLLTNCGDIVNHDFYHPSNIFVFNNSLDGIENFMSTAYQEIPEAVVRQYEINNWLKNNFFESGGYNKL